LTKTLKPGVDGNLFNTIKATYKTPALTPYSMVKAYKFSLKLETRKGCSLLPLLFNTVPEVLVKSIRQGKETKGIQTGKEKVKFCL